MKRRPPDDRKASRQIGYPLIVLCISNGPAVSAAPFITLGPAEIALDQPRVAVEVIEVNGETLTSLGPELFNTFLLDTGATAILAGGNPFDPSLSATGELLSQGLINEAVVEERGVAGTTPFDVSAPYRFDYAGSSGARYSLPNTRILSNDTINLGFDGIVGIPAMLGRVTTFDMSVWSDSSLFDLELMGVGFSETLPIDESHRYTLDVELVRFDAAAEDPTPTSGPLPFVTAGISNADKTQPGRFVFDTGAQLSVISSPLALSVGLDTNTDLILDENDEGYAGLITVGGVGGNIDVPLFNINQIILPTDEGVDLIYQEAQVAIIDIDPAIDGIIGSDLLTSGWLNALLADGPDGYIRKAHLDLLDDHSLSGKLYIDLNPDFDVVVIPTPSIASTYLLLVSMFTYSKRRQMNL